MKPLLIVALVIGGSGVAFARDHQELLCSAVVQPKDGGEKMPVFIQFFEQRAADGHSRQETLSNIYQTALFQASRLNSTGDYSKNAQIVLTSGTSIRFRGKYTVQPTSGGYVMKLVGDLNEDPATGTTFRAISATLSCVDLSI